MGRWKLLPTRGIRFGNVVVSKCVALYTEAREMALAAGYRPDRIPTNGESTRYWSPREEFPIRTTATGRTGQTVPRSMTRPSRTDGYAQAIELIDYGI